MAGIHFSKEKELSLLNITPVPERERSTKAVAAIGKLAETTRSLITMLETCTKCGACAQQCHSFLGTGDYYNIPAARADLMRKVYKRHFTLAGRLLGRFAGAEDFDAATLGKWMIYFYQCNECRRCARFCPFGIDTAEVTIAARQILTYLGIVPKFIAGTAVNAVKTGNNMGITKPALLDSCAFLEDELKEETGFEIKLPVDKEQADILYIPSSADFFTNTDTMMGVAKMFHAVGANWTMASDIIEAGNFGLFFDKEIMKAHNKRLVDAARRVGAKVVVQGECGHGWRVAGIFTDDLNGPLEFPIKHITEIAAAYVTAGKIKLNLAAVPFSVTYHDPCNVARAGGIIEEPRTVVKACVRDFREMIPNRAENFCCGGGSGILMEEIMDIRMKLGKVKADQVRATGAEYLAVPCSICKAQLPHVFKHYDVNVKTGGVMDLVGWAIVLDGNKAAD